LGVTVNDSTGRWSAGVAQPAAHQMEPAALLRRWLRIPERLSVPQWAQGRLLDAARDLARAREGRALDEVVFGIVDLETTGLSHGVHHILEIGLVVQRSGRTLARFETFVDAGVPIPRAITALTGIEESDLDCAPSPAEAIGQLADALVRNRVEVLIAHNAPFDRRFLAKAWEDLCPGPELPPFLCSLRLARRLIRAPSYGLDSLVTRLGIPERSRHRALGDAEMTAFLWRELLLRARLGGVFTLEALGETIRAKPRREASGGPQRRGAAKPRRAGPGGPASAPGRGGTTRA
jgi:DNA polymerase III epsilon subunit-like protein